jgi:SNF2 family DNA or RNA helicase
VPSSSTELGSSKPMESQPTGVTTSLNPFQSSLPPWNPHEYQKRAIRLLLSQASGGLFLDPGLGKTSIVLAAFKILKEKQLARKMLIIAPLRPCYKVWPDEIKKWENFSSLRWTILHGSGKQAKILEDHDIYIINPEGLQWLLNGRRLPAFDILCIDESSKFKDSTTKRFRLLKPLLTIFKRRWILTGTPAPNGLEDLFGQIYILDQGRSLGRYITHFRNLFFQRSGYNLYDWKPRPGAFKEVVEKISPLLIQLSAEDYLQMPEIVNTNISITLPPMAMKVYLDVENEFISLLDSGPIVAANAAVAGGKCRQMANGAVYNPDRSYVVIHDEKLDALEDLLEEFNGAPTLVLYEFQHDRERILARLGDVPVLGDGVSAKSLDSIINRFNAGEIPVLLGHPGSMGHGLNLQSACNRVVWFGIPWNLEFYDQAIARVYRQGQCESRVFVYHIVAKDTKDEDVMKVLTRKDKDQQSLLLAIGKNPLHSD